MRDYVCTDGTPVSKLPSDVIQYILETPGSLDRVNVGFNGATTEDLGERLRIELLIRSLAL